MRLYEATEESIDVESRSECIVTCAAGSSQLEVFGWKAGRIS